MERRKSTQIRKSRYNGKKVSDSASGKKMVSKSARPETRKTVQAHRQQTTGTHSSAAARLRSRHRRKRFRLKPQVKIGGILILALLIIFSGSRVLFSGKKAESKKTKAVTSKEAKTEDNVVEMEVSKEISFQPHSVDSTKPENLISYTDIEVDGSQLASISDYTADSDIEFNVGEDYTDVDGIVTFRGNNFRDSPARGYANMTQYKLNGLWSVDTGSLASGNAVWTGSGWTGQPLMMKWPKEVKAHMNMTEKAKADDDLVEVIYACMDGNVYFLDLKTGEKTRDPLYLGYTFKGAGALDPRGYPIMYVGAGYNSDEGTARVFVVNLIDCSVMYTFGDNDEFSLRGSLSFFDGSALVDAETDTLIYPGENGILYLIKLNTSYDSSTGALSINPGRIVKWHYYGTRSSTESFWIGMEDSAAVYKGYLFIADNGGNLMCLNLNTLELVWVQDTLDDSNSTPVLEIENGHLYLYVSTSFRLGWRSSDSATIPIWKIDAETGEIIWHTDYQCYTDDGVSGGVQSTIACGKNDLSDYIYVTVSKTSDNASGVLVCLNKSDGSKVWEDNSSYAWSSPVCVYNEDGTGKVLYCNSTGDVRLLDGKTGELNNTLSISDGVIEASPAVYDNYMVVGTRDCKIWGIELQ